MSFGGANRPGQEPVYGVLAVSTTGHQWARGADSLEVGLQGLLRCRVFPGVKKLV